PSSTRLLNRAKILTQPPKDPHGRARLRPSRNNQSGRNSPRGSAGASPSRTSPNLEKALALVPDSSDLERIISPQCKCASEATLPPNCRSSFRFAALEEFGQIMNEVNAGHPPSWP